MLKRITEVFQTNHWKERKVDRIEKASLTLPSNFWQKTDDRKQLEKLLQQAVFDRINANIKSFEQHLVDVEPAHHYATVIADVKLKREGKIYIPSIIAKSSDKFGNLKDNEGSIYIGLSKNNQAITLLLVDKSKADSASLTKAVKSHQQRLGGEIDDHQVGIRNLPNFSIVIDVDLIIRNKDNKVEKVTLGINTMPYTVRTDYRTGANLDHKQYGKGTIISTSSGSKGTGDNRGIVSWIEVDFKKPYVSGGKLTSIRRIENLYTTVFFQHQEMNNKQRKSNLMKSIFEAIDLKKYDLTKSKKVAKLFTSATKYIEYLKQKDVWAVEAASTAESEYEYLDVWIKPNQIGYSWKEPYNNPNKVRNDDFKIRDEFEEDDAIDVLKQIIKNCKKGLKAEKISDPSF